MDIFNKDLFKRSARWLAPSLVAIAACFSASIHAVEFVCEVPNDTRYIRVDIPAVDTPESKGRLCEVSVTYQQSGVRDVKWHARNDTFFCSARAYELRDKYVNLWDYDCVTSPDRDGIDLLSESQRLILDRRLKALITLGEQSTPTFTIKSIKAVASNPLDGEPAKIAFQFFTDTGDFTEVIDDRSDDWNIITIIEDLRLQIDSDATVTSALVHAISDEGAVEVRTNVSGNIENTECFGSQTLIPIGSNGAVRASSPHSYVCEPVATVQPTGSGGVQ